MNNRNNIKEADNYIVYILLFILWIVVFSSCSVTVNVYNTPTTTEEVTKEESAPLPVIFDQIPGNKNYKTVKSKKHE